MLQFLPIYLSHREFTPPQHITGRERNNAPITDARIERNNAPITDARIERNNAPGERSYARTERGYAETGRRAATDYHYDILRCTTTMTARGTTAACLIVV